ncbi:MAG: DNA internalization-related competence protein ComEC/Rec2 [Pseudomonadota bacterium]
MLCGSAGGARGPSVARRWYGVGIAILVCTAVSVWRFIETAPHVLAADLDGESVFTTVWLSHLPERQSDGWRLRVRTKDPLFPRRLLVFVPHTLWPRDAAPVACWHLHMRVSDWQPAGNPAGFDGAAYWRARGFGARATALGSPRMRPCSQARPRGMLAVRWQLRRTLARALPAGDTRGVLLALTIGDRSELSAALRGVLARTGVAHLLAISGLHVGLVASALYWLVRRLVSGRVPVAADVAVLAAAAGAVLFAGLSGHGVPAVRAALAGLLMAGAALSRIRIDLLRLVLVLIIVAALVSPRSLCESGFLLSYGAVLLLALWQQASILLASRLRGRAREALGVQLLLSVAMAPLLGKLFGQIPAVAVPVNLVCVPLFGLLVVPLALLGVLLALFETPFAGSCWQLAATLVTWTLDGLVWLDMRWSLAWPVRPWPWLQTLLATVLVVVGFLLRRRWLVLPALVALIALLAPRVAKVPLGCVDLLMLNVGHGTAIVLQTGGGAVLFDTGPSWRQGGDAAAAIVLPALRAHGITRLELVLISHDDNDHDGGVETLAANVPVGHWLGGPGVACRAGLRWRLGGVEFKTLWPPSPVPGRVRNDASCVLSIQVGSARALLFGDIGRAAETQLVRLQDLSARMVTAPHHGSQTSSSPALIAATGADIVLMSAGRRRGWSIPHPTVKQRWRETGADVRITAQHGAQRHRLCRVP